jgi:hypothetical protein
MEGRSPKNEATSGTVPFYGSVARGMREGCEDGIVEGAR